MDDTVARTAPGSKASVGWLHGATEAEILADAWGRSSVIMSTPAFDNGFPFPENTTFVIVSPTKTPNPEPGPLWTTQDAALAAQHFLRTSNAR